MSSSSISTNFHPCCGLISLKTGTKIIAIFQIVIFLAIPVLSCTLTLVRFFLWPVPYLSTPPDGTNNNGTIIPFLGDEKKQFTFFILQLPIIFWGLTAFIAAITLFKGARDKIRSKCVIWMVINVTITSLGTLGLFVVLIFFDSVSIVLPIGIFVAVLFHLYFILVVYCFMQKMQVLE